MGAGRQRAPLAPPRVPAPRLRARALQCRCACSWPPPPRVPWADGRARERTRFPETGVPAAATLRADPSAPQPNAPNLYFTETPSRALTLPALSGSLPFLRRSRTRLWTHPALGTLRCGPPGSAPRSPAQSLWSSSRSPAPRGPASTSRIFPYAYLQFSARNRGHFWPQTTPTAPAEPPASRRPAPPRPL
ncbi:predicted GPI-anchored protein 58 [Tupaia chinensis]|uniref:predicted GPI-anchored protein 58 n=1 Tax=Tupaia chinensis TaxID=246437 RepID=UPI0007042895|nr:predicted GPI-anchored protein 58 [Tupaia chinensis]